MTTEGVGQTDRVCFRLYCAETSPRGLETLITINGSRIKYQVDYRGSSNTCISVKILMIVICYVSSVKDTSFCEMSL